MKYIIYVSILLRNSISFALLCPPGCGGRQCELQLSSIYHEHAHHVYNLTLLRPLDLHGWGMDADVYQKLAESVSAQLIVEVGVWKGASSAIFAQWLKDKGHGVIVSVDTWLGALEFWTRRFSNGNYDVQRDLSWRHGYPSVYYTFLSNIIRKNLSDYVIPFPVTSRLASDLFFEKKYEVDLIHIDAAHEYADVIEDIRLWWRNVRPGGIMMGDDYTAGWPGVVAAAQEFSKQQRLTLETHGSKWWIKRP